MSEQEKDQKTPAADATDTQATADTEVPHAELHLMLEDARSKADENWNAYLRAQAEQENLRRRHQKELENAHKFALEKFVQELLPIRDGMEMGLTAAQNEGTDLARIREGLELTLKMMTTAMDKFEVRALDPLGEKFNPDQHQAMSLQESAEVEPNCVLHVIQKGYTLNDRLVRPALVVVAKAPAGAGSGSTGYEKPAPAGGQIDDQA